MPEEGVIREALPGQGADTVEDPLDWTEAERKALSGEADAEAAETTDLRAVPPTDDPAPEASGDGVPAGEAEGASPKDDQDDPAKFIDTRERKESYTAEEWGQLVRQRDYFQRTNQELKTEITTFNERADRIEKALTAKDAPPPPDKTDDPAGYLEQKISATDEKVTKVAESLEERAKRDEVVRQQQQFEQASTYAQNAHLQQTGQTEEQFVGKMVAIRQDRFEDFMEEGYSQEQAYNLTIGWEQTMIAKSFERGENPATVFDRRFARRGLKPATPNITNQPNDEVNSGQEPRPGTPAGPSAQELVTRAQEGQKSQSLPRGEGAARSFKVTYASLAKLSPEEFDEVMGQIEGTSKEDELDMVGETSVVLK